MTTIEQATAKALAKAEYHDYIRAALKIAEGWKFSPTETAAMLGLMPHLAENPEAFETFCVSASSLDILARCKMIVGIHRYMQKLGGDHIAMLDRPGDSGQIDRRSPRQRITSGDYFDIEALHDSKRTRIKAA